MAETHKIKRLSVEKIGASAATVIAHLSKQGKSFGSIEFALAESDITSSREIPLIWNVVDADSVSINYTARHSLEIGGDKLLLLMVWVESDTERWLVDFCDLTFPLFMNFKTAPLKFRETSFGERDATANTRIVTQRDFHPAVPESGWKSLGNTGVAVPDWKDATIDLSFDEFTKMVTRDAELPVVPATTDDESDKLPSGKRPGTKFFNTSKGFGLILPDTRRDQVAYDLWFATNRKPSIDRKGRLSFLADRDETTHFGQCEVIVPKSHKIGSLGSPLLTRWVTLSDDRLKLTSTGSLSYDTWWRTVRERLATVDPTQQHTVIFLHGFNVTFDDAALRAAQIGFDLQIRGPMMFFSWPSKGDPLSYEPDESTIEASEIPITQFLADVVSNSGADRIHLIAHSMGNRALLRAVDRIAEQVKEATRKPFSQIILAAPDVDRDVFKQLAGAYPRVAERTTLYISTRDWAVGTSEWLHDWPRAGLAPPVTVVPGIDTINVTKVDLTALGHGYIASARSVLQDMHALIMQGLAPDRRFGLQRVTDEAGVPYWDFVG